MKAPISWLKEYVDINVSADELANKLVNCGFEIEQIIDLSKKIKGVITGKIVKIERHANANKLQICTLDMGNATLQIVTGANNVFEGAIVPVATDGAELPGGTVIKTGELRGVLSQGMLCSGKELDVDNYDIDGAEVDGILILDKNTKIGIDINSVIGNDDIVLDVAVTANRPDCNSIIGIAREIAAALCQKIKIPNTSVIPKVKNPNPIKVTIKNSSLCPNYIAAEVGEIVITKSPKWLVKRLKMTDHKPYNNIVDLTNYILVELGQPMHAFDRANLSEIIVRTATDGEQFTTLMNEEKALDCNTLVISDTNKALAIAGIMGGLDSSISATTKNIVFESAKFTKESIRKTSRRLNLRSDSSARFEKGIDIYTQQFALDRALEIVSNEGWGKVRGGYSSDSSENVFTKSLSFTEKDIKDILGIDIDCANIIKILTNLGFTTSFEKEKITTTVPPYREDIDGINDIAEELIRFYGYDKIESTLLDKAMQTIGGIGEYNKFINKLKRVLVGNGLYEIVTYSFTSPKCNEMLSLPVNPNIIKLLNPLGEELSVMRTNLAHSILEILSSNFTKGNKEAMLYEFGKIYVADSLPLDKLPTEKNILSIGMYGADMDFYSIKHIIDLLLRSATDEYRLEYFSAPYMHDGRSAEIFIKGVSVGYFGEVHPTTLAKYEIAKRAYIAEINLDVLMSFYDESYSFKNISKYQSVTRDIALVVDKNLTAQSIISEIKGNAENLTNVSIFDVYQGNQVKEGQKSIALTLEFRANKTLTDGEITSTMDKILFALRAKFDAQIRV